MTPAAELELLTRAVDGDLSAGERRDLRRLLSRSADARTLFGQLKVQSDRLRRLPKVSPPADLAARVITRVRELPPYHSVTPAPLPFAPPARRRSWALLAVAASLFLALGASSFWFAHRRSAANTDTAQTGDFRQRPANGRDRNPLPIPVDPVVRDALPPEHGPLASLPPASEERHADLLPRELLTPPPAASPLEVAVAPRPVRSPSPDLMGADFGRVASFAAVRVRLPFLTSLAEVHDRPGARDQLLRELQHDTPYRLDLFAANAGRGLESVIEAAKGCGITLHVDAAARDRLKKKQPTTFVVYVDGLTSNEVRDLVARLAADDAKRPARAFDLLHLTPAQPADGKDLRELLGLDPGLWKRPDAAPKAITAGTADQVVRAMAGGGKPEKAAVALAYLPANARVKPAASKELQQFLAKRGDRKPTAVPLMLVIRGTN